MNGRNSRITAIELGRASRESGRDTAARAVRRWLLCACVASALGLLPAAAAGAAPTKPSPPATNQPAGTVERGEDEDEEAHEPETSSRPPAGGETNGPTRRRRGASAKSAATPAAGAEDDDGTTLAVEADLNSRFAWRGMSLSSGAALQPSALASYAGFTAIAFSNVLLNAEPEQKRLSAFVSSVSWALDWKALRIEPGVVWYNFFSSLDVGPHSTFELSLDASVRLGAVRLLATNHVDVRARAGAYYGTLGPEFERETGRWTLKAGADVAYASASFNDEYFGTSSTALNLVEGRLGAQYDLSDHVYFALHAEVSTLVAPSLRASVAEPTLVVGGAALGLQL
jgi:hypothetical protein